MHHYKVIYNENTSKNGETLIKRQYRANSL